MPSRATLRKGDKRVLIEFAGSAQDVPSMAQVRSSLHANLFRAASRAGARRVGPVVWHVYEAAAAPKMLQGAGLIEHKGAVGLIAWLASNPGTVLVVGTVDVVMPRPPRKRRPLA